jgi:hypothetical protein
MGIEMGRVSGPLLSENLLRNGEDLAFETDLLYLDVITGKVGIRNSAPQFDLFVNNFIKSTNLIVDTQLSFSSNYVVNTDKIQNILGSIIFTPDQSSDPKVVAAGLGIANLTISAGKNITNIVSDDVINLNPNGTGIVHFTTDTVNVNGNLHSTGTITADGNIIIGNETTDSVIFNALVDTTLVPILHNTHNLGSLSKRWKTIYTSDIKGTSTLLALNDIILDNTRLATTTGNMIYVSINGVDTNLGYHKRSPFKTLKHALSVATTGCQIFINSGTYVEDFPLLIPQGVNVTGESIRSVTIKPSIATNTNDAFLLNDETSVSSLTIQDFFYNSATNTGYAFKFAPGYNSTYKSPYIQNITVITKGSVTSLADPLGFLQGDAGAGIYLDGSVAAPTSNTPSCLFNTVTLITPNQNAITATNGVRVEWINSFTYYAKRGIFLINGIEGFASIGNTAAGYDSIVGFYGQSGITLTGPNAKTVTVNVSNIGLITIVNISSNAESGIYISPGGTRWIINLGKFGAEFRGINSANIYGTYGIIADGPDTLAYICGHNFGYIGSGANSLNDPSTTDSTNEVISLNYGVIYYDSVDHNGNYQIGDVLYINQKTGQVLFDARSMHFNEDGNITLQSDSHLTVVDFFKIQTGNIKIFNNTISSIVGEISLHAVSDIRLNTNIFVTGSLGISDDLTVAGNVYVGNELVDTTAISANFVSSIIPNTNNTYTLGTNLLRWDVLRSQIIHIDSILITDNTVTTSVPGTDLELFASNTGRIYVPLNDVQIDNNLTVENNTTVTGNTSLQDVEITGTTTLTGNITQTGNIDITGNLINQDNIIQDGVGLFLDIPNITIQDNLITPITSGSDLVIYGGVLQGAILENLKITNSILENIWQNASTDYEKSIVFTPIGTGNVVINSNKSIILPIGTNSTQPLSNAGEIRFNSDTTLFDGYLPSGMVSFYSLFDTDRNTYITPELTPGTNDNIFRFATNGTVKAKITATELYSNSFHISNVKILGNTIGTVNTSNDLLIQPTSGILTVNDIHFSSNYITNTLNDVIHLPTIKFTGGATGMLVPQGTDSQRRNVPNVAEFRYNTEQHLYEVYDGIQWIPQGDNPLLMSTVDEEITLWAILLG